jgi:acyl-coenzyme A synthetase/AMP-(fatty) acid ligase
LRWLPRSASQTLCAPKSLRRSSCSSPAATPELAAEIQTFVKTRLSGHEYPREVAFIDDMPMTTTGKVIRRLLRERD